MTIDVAAPLRDWLVQAALPLWADRGVDRREGGFHEMLNGPDAAPIDEPRRTRVVARQVYVFATAQRMGWLPGASALVDHGLRFLATRLLRPDGTYASAVQTDGRIVRPEFDLYEQAFALFAMAAASDGSNAREGLPQAAAALLQVLRERYAHPHAGFEESAPPSVPLRANPHMHLLEAALAWSEQPGAASVWRELADELATLCLRHFIDPRSGAVREYFDAHWQPMPDARGRVVEPGHQFEWAWLLMRWGAARRRADAVAAAQRLVEIGERFGVDAARNVAVNELDDALRVVDGNAKLWPQTERLKAWCAVAEAAATDAARAAALERVVLAMRGLMQYFRAAPAGLWGESVDAHGQLAQGPSRASSLYHIVCAAETVCSVGRTSR